MNKPNSFFRWIYNRVIKKNKNAIIVTVGATGSGKSWSNLRIAEVGTRVNLNKEFDPKNITFTPKEAMQRINSGEMKRGDFLIMEEVGVSMSSREWWSLTNRVLSYLTQTFREKGYVVLMNTPSLSFVDSNIRRLLHCIITMKGINFRNNTVIIIPRLVQVNATTGKSYPKKIRVRVGKKHRIVEYITLEKPSKELIQVYETKKKNYIDELNKSIEEKILYSEFKEKKEIKKMERKPLTKLQEKIKYWKDKGLLQKDIAKKIKKSPTLVSLQVGIMRRKGW